MPTPVPRVLPRCLGLSLVVTGLLLLSAWTTQAQQSLPSCAERLQLLGRALSAYAADHAGSLPPDLGTLYRDRYVSCELWAFWCPEDSGTQRLPTTIDTSGSYELVAERLEPGSDRPLVRERAARHGGDGLSGRYRHVLLQDGRVVQQMEETASPTSGPATDRPPTVQFASGSRTDWEPYESVAYQWVGSDDQTAPDRLEYRLNFSLTGMSDWSPTTHVELGRLRPGDHVLEVWVRDVSGQVCLSPAYLRFHVRPRNPIARMEPVERRMQTLPKAPTSPPARPLWYDQKSPLRRVDIRTVDPEADIIRARQEGADLTGPYVAADDPGRFQPDQTGFAPLVFRRGFPWLHVMLYFAVLPGASRPDFSYDLTWNGRTIGKQRIPSTEADGRILHLRLHMVTASEFRVGKYRLGVSVNEARVCDLFFNVVEGPVDGNFAQPVRCTTLQGLRLGTDKASLSRQLPMASGTRAPETIQFPGVTAATSS